MQKDIIYKFRGSDESFRSSDALPVGESAGRFVLERMKNALSSDAIQAPSGMSIEEMRKFILAHAGK